MRKIEGRIKRTDNGFQVVWVNKKGKECSRPLGEQSGESFVKDGAVVNVLLDENGQFVRVEPRTAGSQQSRAAGPAHREESSGRGSQQSTDKFYNPYYFIPMPGRNTGDKDLGDSAPADHGVFSPDRWSGCIRVKLTTETPLLVPDAQHAEEENGHKTYPVRMVNGRPYLSPTSVKGMLRSAYEAITNSRMGVFNEYRDRPGFRTPPNEGLKLVPARIEDQSGVLKVRLLPGTSEITEDGPEPQEIAKHGNKAKKKEKEKKIPIMYAAFHDAYDKKTKQVSSPSLPKHGQKVWFKKSLRNLGVFAFWEATELKKAKPEENDWIEGYFFCSNLNIDKKHYERIFFHEGNQQYVCDLTPEVQAQWEALIGDYQKIHEEEIRRGLTRPPVLKNERCEWSHQIADPKVRDLRDGTLCYAEVKPNGHGGFDVVGLYPVQISRNISPSSPFDVIANSDQKHHLPATDYEHLSPADRVFGWVSQSGGGNRPAYKGNVRIGHVECTTGDAVEEFARPGLPLAILGAPKHAQARFYLGDENGGPQQDGISRKDAAYKLGKMLRGRKVYPHQKDLERQYWAWPVRNRESCFYAQPEDERTDQNRSILGWVKPGAVFEFSIHFTNLTDVELGALLWLLDLPEGCFHRLGGGKPLGFGSVRLEIDRSDSGNWILRGSDLAAYYKSLCEAPPSGDIGEKVESLKKAFEDAVRSVYGQGGNDPKFIQAFLKAAEGFDGRRTHYPRKQRRASEAIYKWFAENEKVGKRGGRKLSLPSLLDEDPSLPYDPTT